MMCCVIAVVIFRLTKVGPANVIEPRGNDEEFCGDVIGSDVNFASPISVYCGELQEMDMHQDVLTGNSDTGFLLVTESTPALRYRRGMEVPLESWRARDEGA